LVETVFLLARTASEEIIAYNGSGRSPRNFPVEEYLKQKPTRGPLTVTVSDVNLWGRVYENYCSKDFYKFLKPAISLARNGFYVQEPLVKAIEHSRSELARYRGWFKIF